VSKVKQLDAAVQKTNVVGLQIAINDTPTVDVGQSGSELAANVQFFQVKFLGGSLLFLL